MPARSARRGPSRAGRRSPGPRAAPGAQLDRILGREKWHRTGGGWISGAIYGANDGLAAVFGIVAGVSGATGGSSSVLTAGPGGGDRLGAVDGDRRVPGRALRSRGGGGQRRARAPGDRRASRGGEGGAVALLPAQGHRRAHGRRAAPSSWPSIPTRCCRRCRAEEFGATAVTAATPVEAALAAGISTGLGAIVPVIPFMITTGTIAIVLAAVVSLIAHFLVGAAKSLVTLRTWWSAGLEMTLAGVIVGGATYLRRAGATRPEARRAPPPSRRDELGRAAPRPRASSSAATRDSRSRPSLGAAGRRRGDAAARRRRRTRRSGARSPPSAEQLLEAVLLLARPPAQAARVAALGEHAEHPLDVVERARARHPLAARLELAGRLRPAEQQHRAGPPAPRDRAPSPSSARWRYLVARLPWPLARRASP